MSKSRVPMEQLTSDELERSRAFALARHPREAVVAMKLDEQTVYRVLSGYPVHRSTAQVIRALISTSKI
jgi:hypothetical protein